MTTTTFPDSFDDTIDDSIDDSIDIDAQPKSQNGLGYFFFIVLTGVLLIRPAELLPSLEGMPLYEIVIILCTLASFPGLIRVLSARCLYSAPAALCVVALLPVVFLSSLQNGLFSARVNSAEFAKLLVYFLLLLALIDSPKRLKSFLFAIAIFVIVMAILPLVQYYGLVDLNLVVTCSEKVGENPRNGDPIIMERLQSIGIFSDPNDFSLVLVASMLICAHFMLEQRQWIRRLFWLLPILMLGHAFQLTHSRGGFLSLLGGILSLVINRIGWRKSIPILAISLPLMFLIFGGRQTNIDLENRGDTGQGRILLWRDSLVVMHRAPMLGIGLNQLADEIGQVAHNSYVHAFAELGLVGGSLFIGAFYIVAGGLRRLRRAQLESTEASDELWRWQPYIIAILAGYAVGLLSLSRFSSLMTYIVLGISIAFVSLRSVQMPHVELPSADLRTARKVCITGVLCCLFFHVVVKVMAR
ncbi:MAG TPA: O-antigen ligase family protein [Tepidisphaeraceae bacterium]|jgi:hypothetical protein|nr:O-antigen ligase family protein [Tepidisphaeraceae bacterium]